MFNGFLLSFALRKKHARAAVRAPVHQAASQAHQKRGTRLSHIPLEISGSISLPEQVYVV
jgi:hypothetical protein